MRASRAVSWLLSSYPGSSLKRHVYRLFGADIGRDVHFAPGVIIKCSDLRKVRIGAGGSIGLNAKLICEGITLGDRVRIGGDCNIRGDGHIVIGDDAFIGVGCILDCHGEVLVGDAVQIAPGAIILTHDTSGNVYCHSAIKGERTQIMAGAYVGSGAIVLPGRTVGCNAIVGAGAVVTKDVGPGETVVGVPARLIEGSKVKGAHGSHSSGLKAGADEQALL